MFFYPGGNNLTGINIDLSFEDIGRKVVTWEQQLLLQYCICVKLKI